MKYSRLIALFLFAASFAAAVERIGAPVSPSLWDSYLPNPAHPSYASNLGALLEGRLTLGFQNTSLGHMSLSVPGLQIISANTRWQVKPDQDRWSYDSKHAYLAENGRYRGLFLVAGGGRLSSILPLNNWDLGIGGTFKSLTVEDKDEEEIWKANWLGLSFSLSVNSILLSGSWDKYEQRYLLAYNDPGNFQAGIEFYQHWDAISSSSFGAQPGIELTFYESMKFHSGMRWQFAESYKTNVQKRVEFMLNFGVGFRFRPWRAGTDPAWIDPIVSPFDAAIFYDWELSFDVSIDTEYKTYYWLTSISKWF